MIPSADAILAAVRTVTGIDPLTRGNDRHVVQARRTAIYLMDAVGHDRRTICKAMGCTTTTITAALASADAGVFASASRARRLLDREVA